MNDGHPTTMLTTGHDHGIMHHHAYGQSTIQSLEAQDIITPLGAARGGMSTQAASGTWSSVDQSRIPAAALSWLTGLVPAVLPQHGTWWFVLENFYDTTGVHPSSLPVDYALVVTAENGKTFHWYSAPPGMHNPPPGATVGYANKIYVPLPAQISIPRAGVNGPLGQVNVDSPCCPTKATWWLVAAVFTVAGAVGVNAYYHVKKRKGR